MQTVDVYRTPPANASGSADIRVISGLVVDIQPADEDPHERQPFPSTVSTARLKTWWDVWVLQMPLPAIQPHDRLVDLGETDAVTGQPAQYRVRRVNAFEGRLHCERDASPISN